MATNQFIDVRDLEAIALIVARQIAGWPVRATWLRWVWSVTQAV